MANVSADVGEHSEEDERGGMVQGSNGAMGNANGGGACAAGAGRMASGHGSLANDAPVGVLKGEGASATTAPKCTKDLPTNRLKQRF